MRIDLESKKKQTDTKNETYTERIESMSDLPDRELDSKRDSGFALAMSPE